MRSNRDRHELSLTLTSLGHGFVFNLFPRIKSAPFLRSIGAQAQAEVLKHQRRLQSSLDAVNL